MQGVLTLKSLIRFTMAGVLLIHLVGQAASADADNVPPFPAFYRTASLFADAIASERTRPPLEMNVTGLTVPHHLLAVDS